VLFVRFGGIAFQWPTDCTASKHRQRGSDTSKMNCWSKCDPCFAVGQRAARQLPAAAHAADKRAAVCSALLLMTGRKREETVVHSHAQEHGADFPVRSPSPLLLLCPVLSLPHCSLSAAAVAARSIRRRKGGKGGTANGASRCTRPSLPPPPALLPLDPLACLLSFFAVGASGTGAKTNNRRTALVWSLWRWGRKAREGRSEGEKGGQMDEPCDGTFCERAMHELTAALCSLLNLTARTSLQLSRPP
jgi:hypothetical protein